MKKNEPRDSNWTFWSALALAAVGLLLGLVSGAAYEAVESRLPASPVSLETAAGRLEAVLEEPDVFRRAGRVAQIFRGLEALDEDENAEHAFAALRRVFEQAHVYDGDIEFALFASWWARSDPEAAYRWRSYAPQGRGASVLVAIAEEWGRSDLLGAVRTLRREPAAELRVAGWSAALFGADAAHVEDSKIVEALAEIADRGERRRALGVLLRRRLARSPGENELIEWGEQIESPSSEIAQDLFTTIAITLASSSPERAAALLSRRRLENADPLPAGTLAAVANGWSLTDPKAALEWLSAFDPGSEETLAIRTAFQRWLVQERAVALSWAADRIAEKDEGAWLDPVRAAYGLILGYDDPEAGLHVIFELPFGQNRAWAVAQIFGRWKSAEPEAAEAWLRDVDLPAFRRQQLRDLPVPTQPIAPTRDEATPQKEVS